MTRIAALALAFALSAGSAPLLAAEQPGPDWMPLEQVKKSVMATGYTEITKIEVDDGHWDGEGVKNGRKMKFEADPKTGVILGEMEE
ncbi:MAG TPA: PepSY domain-containing protein [Methylobacterium sp.]|jgi:hypothetical protein